jgi:hypothetical protein
VSNLSVRNHRDPEPKRLPEDPTFQRLKVGAQSGCEVPARDDGALLRHQVVHVFFKRDMNTCNINVRRNMINIYIPYIQYIYIDFKYVYNVYNI